jgi:hypothetical protein
VIVADSLEHRRRGRPPKPDKGVPLSVLVRPALRGRLVALAEDSHRSLSGQVTLLLERGVTQQSPLPMPSAPRHDRQTHNEAGSLANNIGARAGAFLEMNYPGGRKDKRIAHDLGISQGMAKTLRAGRGWTVARIDQAMALWPGFRDFLFPAVDRLAELLEQLAAGFDRLAGELGKLRGELHELRAENRGGNSSGVALPPGATCDQRRPAMALDTNGA